MKASNNLGSSEDTLEEPLIVCGRVAPLLFDLEKARTIDEGSILVPWCGIQSLLIDRYDCRAHLTDLSEHESVPVLAFEDYMSEDDITIEKMCDFERYLEMQMDVDEMLVQEEENAKRGSEGIRGRYGAVDFSYDSNLQDAAENLDGNTQVEADCTTPAEDPYTCPPELQGYDYPLPESDKQAQIIERTAVFVARQGNQMEIILKAKQTSSPLFGFLTYDNILNPFYKNMVKLIRQGRYVPKIRPANKHEVADAAPVEPNKSINEDVYELKLPKVDISNTAYASLINKFKKVNEIALQSQQSAASEAISNSQASPKTTGVDSSGDHDDTAQELEKDNTAEEKRSRPQSPVAVEETSGSVATDTASQSYSVEEYEQCYQEYYKHYYSHYYSQFSEQFMRSGALTPLTSEQQTIIVDQAAKAAAVAASAAVNAMHQARAKKVTPVVEAVPNSYPPMTSGEKAIIEKMAEYVIRNGPEFEELVVSQKKNDKRFGFLNEGHPFYEYYVNCKRQLETKPESTATTNGAADISSKEQSADISEKSKNVSPAASPLNDDAKTPQPVNTLPTSRSSSISFKVTRPIGPSKHRSSNTDSNPTSTYADPDATQSDDGGTDLKSVASCPVLLSTSPAPISVPSMTSDEQDSFRTRKKRRRSRSPVLFSLPGIPCASSSDSSAPSSPAPYHSPVHQSPTISAPDHAHVSSPVLLLSSQTQTPAVANVTPVHQMSHQAHSPSPAPPTTPPPPPRHTSSQKSRKTESSHDKHPKAAQRSHLANGLANSLQPSRKLTSEVGESTIEELLDIVHSPSRKSHKSPSSSRDEKTLDDEELQLRRRKRAALLVAQLKQSTMEQRASPPPPSVSSSLPPPPPAPDSVPAAVAHAVVASLKLRHKASLAALDADRKRHRSPPAAYALPRGTSRSAEYESSRDRTRDSDRHKHKKHSRDMK